MIKMKIQDRDDPGGRAIGNVFGEYAPGFKTYCSFFHFLNYEKFHHL
jgi:hypothetical protein